MIFILFCLICGAVIIGSIVFVLGSMASTPSSQGGNPAGGLIGLILFVGGLLYVIHLFTRPDCDWRDRFSPACQLERSGE